MNPGRTGTSNKLYCLNSKHVKKRREEKKNSERNKAHSAQYVETCKVYSVLIIVLATD